MGGKKARALIAFVAKRHGIPAGEAARLTARFLRRAREHQFGAGWWLELLDAQFLTHVGPCPRVRCGEEQHLSHLTPPPGGLCHDCGCAVGEYHVFGCDAEECSGCGGQAFCCDCGDDSATLGPLPPLPHGDAA